MKHISYSQMSIYDKCPYRWKLQYVDGISKFKPNIYIIFGSAMHVTLQKYIDVMYTESVKEANNINLFSELQVNLINEFKNYKIEGGHDPCTKEELKQFFDDGIVIINWFKKHRGSYFSKKYWRLIGCEVPLNVKLKKNIEWVAYLDIVLYHEPTNRIKIIDIKTSTRGWNKYQKKDKNKTSQLLLYKKFYSKQHNCSMDSIDIEYFIVKRKLYENFDFPQKRIQLFTPAHGNVSMNKVSSILENFIDNAFNDDGTYSNNEFKAIPSKSNCKFCDFNQTKHCKFGV